MGLADIEAVINSIPAKKKDLQKAFDELQSYSSSFTSYTFQWMDIEEHITSMEKSIGQRFQELKALDMRLEADNPAAPLPVVNAKEDQPEPDVEPRPRFKSLCINMDAKALRSCLDNVRRGFVEIRRELGRALLFAPDPITLVLDSFEGFAPVEGTVGGEAYKIRRACLTLLGSLHEISLNIKPVEKERARGLAVECKGLITDGKMENAITVLLFLQLIVTFGLVDFFKFDVLDLLVMVAARRNTLDLCMNSILKERVPDLIEKLNCMGRQIDSIKFVIAFNLISKYPPDLLLNAYIKESKWPPARDRLKERNSPTLELEAVTREISAIKTAIKVAIKVVEEYHLQHVYPPNDLRALVKQLENKWRGIGRTIKWNDASSTISGKMPRRRERVRKKFRQSLNSAETIIAAQSEFRYPPQLGFIVGGNSGPVAPPRPYMHPSVSMTGPAYYDGVPAYGRYFMPGFPTGL